MDEKANNNHQHQLDRDRLILELQRLRQAIHDLTLGNRDTEPLKTKWLAVYRIFNGLETEAWDAVASRHGLDEWLALPLDQESYPGLSLLQERLSRLAHLSDHDPLTGLANRRAMDRMLKLEVERTQRFKTPFSLALFDLDDFKRVNDTWGHACGDAVLVNFANTVSARIRRIDVLARHGGEEFALLLPGTGQIRSEHMMARVQQAVADMRTYCPTSPSSVKVTCSIGVATFRGRAALSWEEIFEMADTALYKAKHQGKNQVVAAPLSDRELTYDTTEVRHEEKKFLFSKD
ncbi:MAG: GGDEF domain-containing protein [Desulfohalobiaceae bacterium]